METAYSRGTFPWLTTDHYEAAEFSAGTLQALWEPLEQRRVDLVRAGRRAWFPARFQVLLTLNPVPGETSARRTAVVSAARGYAKPYGPEERRTRR